MMDRNTLTALLLIALVLILTPYYMDLISPNQKNDYELVENEQYGGATSGEYADTDRSSEPLEKFDPGSHSKTTEKIITIESDLYIAKISSLSGGSVFSYKIKEHLLADSNYVSLITNENKDNLLLSFKNLDGSDVSIREGWLQEGPTDSVYLFEETFLVSYINNIGGKKITKTLTFYPDDFIVDIDIDLTTISNNVFANTFSVGWTGGLPTTEKDTVSEATFFGAYLYQGSELLEVKVSPGETFSNNYRGQTDWVASRSKYFVVSLFDDRKDQILGSTVSATFDNRELYDIAVNLKTDRAASISLYLGPLEYERIKSLKMNLESIMNFGWAIIRPIAKGVLWVLKSMHAFIPNYGLILIIFSIMVKLLVYPLTKKSYQSMQAMQAIQPEINTLREKYKNNPTKLNQATMELYKKKGVNPLGSCFPMLLQMPLLISLFTVFRSTIELRGEPFVFWIKDLSAPDIIFNLPFKIPIYGDYVCALPILMALSMYAQQRMMSVSGGPQQEQQKMMQYFMMGFFFLLFNSFPSGLNLYYTLFNVLTIAQQKITGAGPQTKRTEV